MAIKKIIQLDVDSRDAQKNLEQLTATLKEQQKITVEFREELIKLEKQLKDTPKNALSEQKALKDRINGLRDAIKEQRVEERKLALKRKDSVKDINDLSDAQGAYSQLTSEADSLTGGLASTFLKLRGAAKKGGAAMKTALISSGIGAAVALLGLIVEHWDDISELVGLTSRKQERIVENQKESLRLTDDELTLVEEKLKLIELEGGSTSDILIDKRKLLILQAEQNTLLLDALSTQLKLEESKNKEVSLLEQTKIFLAGSLSPSLAAVERAKAKLKNNEKTLAIEKQINDSKIRALKIAQQLQGLDNDEKKKKEKKLDDNKKTTDKRGEEIAKEIKDAADKSKALVSVKEGFENEIKNIEAKSAQEKLDLQKKRAQDELNAMNGSATDLLNAQTSLNANFKKKQDELNIKLEEEAKEKAVKLSNEKLEQSLIDAENNEIEFDARRQVLKDRALLIQEDENLTDEKKISDKKKLSEAIIDIDKIEADTKNKLQNLQLNNAAAGVKLGASLFEKSKGVKAAALIAENGIGIATNIINTQAANAKLTAETGVAAPALIVANQVRMGIGIAASVAATAKGLSALGKGGGGGGASASGGGTPPAAPAFNLVGGTGTNQIQDTVEGGDAPIQAIVVSSAVTSAQEADRNAIEGATLG